MQPSETLIISIKEARKLLGKDGKKLSDNQVENLVITLTEASSLLLNQNVAPIIQQTNGG